MRHIPPALKSRKINKLARSFFLLSSLAISFITLASDYKNTGNTRIEACDGMICEVSVINWVVTWQGEYIIQSIDHYSFPDPDANVSQPPDGNP